MVMLLGDSPLTTELFRSHSVQLQYRNLLRVRHSALLVFATSGLDDEKIHVSQLRQEVRRR
jgi:hypothetical protein